MSGEDAVPVQTAEVETGYGKVSGIVAGGTARFLGIPYSAETLAR